MDEEHENGFTIEFYKDIQEIAEKMWYFIILNEEQARKKHLVV